MSEKEKNAAEYRGVRDEIRQQQLKTRDMTLKGKLKYFWDYYKIHALVCILVLIFIVTFVHDIATQRILFFAPICFILHRFPVKTCPPPLPNMQIWTQKIMSVSLTLL